MIDILLISAAIVASPTIHKKMDLSELYPREVQRNSRFKVVQRECWYEFIHPVRGPEIEEYDIPTILHPVFGRIRTEPLLTETQEWKTAEHEYKSCIRALLEDWKACVQKTWAFCDVTHGLASKTMQAPFTEAIELETA